MRKSRRPFPWFCPKCRHKEVRRQPVLYKGRVIPIPKCDHCGELVFDYEADEAVYLIFGVGLFFLICAALLAISDYPFLSILVYLPVPFIQFWLFNGGRWQ